MSAFRKLIRVDHQFCQELALATEHSTDNVPGQEPSGFFTATIAF
jgi:hypothetical protein